MKMPSVQEAVFTEEVRKLHNIKAVEQINVVQKCPRPWAFVRLPMVNTPFTCCMDVKRKNTGGRILGAYECG